MKQLYILFLLTTTFAFGQLTPPAELQSYYQDVDLTLTGTALYDDLAAEVIASHSPILSYSDRHDYLYDADEDLNNPDNVILMYSGESRYEEEYLSGNNTYSPQTFNTEHVYPQSMIGNTAKGDLHHLRSCDININSNRGNDPFADGSGSYTDMGSSWFPGDEWKGDVARMMMYLNLRYDEPFSDVGSLSLFLQWNIEDPVSDFEDQRNTVISGAQGTRNPFIDNPYLATIIWGDDDAENRWETMSVQENNLETVTLYLYPNPVKGNTFSVETPKTLQVEVFNVLGKRVLKTTVTPNNKSVNIQNLKNGVYLVKLNNGNEMVTKKLVRQ